MKLKVEKLKSGSYRIRHTYNKHTYSVVVPYEPDAKEAMTLMLKKMEDCPPEDKTDNAPTMKYYCEKYIQYCEEKGKSPATIRAYKSMQKAMSDSFASKRLARLTNDDVKEEIDLYHGDGKRQPKSVKNYYSLIHSIFAHYRPTYKLMVNLPKITKKAKYEPTTDDIKRVLESVKGTKWEIVFELCTRGLRRGEAVCIYPTDIDKKNVLTVSKDLVQNSEGKYVIKDHPKTEESYRRIPIPKDLADKIRKAGISYEGDPHEINVQLQRELKKLGIPKFNLHMLRHFSAAYLHKQGFTDEQIMAWLGWSSPEVMQEVYRYNLDPHESMADIKKAFDGLS